MGFKTVKSMGMLLMCGTVFAGVHEPASGVIKIDSHEPAHGISQITSDHVQHTKHSNIKQKNQKAMPPVAAPQKHPSNKMGSCDDNAFITSGNDLLTQISSQGYDCVERLFGAASDQVLLGTFTEANMGTVTDEIIAQAATYDGTDPGRYMTSMYYWTKAFYYYGNRQLLTVNNQTQMKNAINALINNSHFYDQTEAHAAVVSYAMANINNALIGDQMVPLVDNMLDNFNASFNAIDDWASVFATVIWDILNECAWDEDCRAAEHSSQLVKKMGDYIQDNMAWLDRTDADFHLHNLAAQLSNFYVGDLYGEPHFNALNTELELQLTRIFNDQGPLKTDTGRRAYLQAMAGVNYFQKCAIYNLCGKTDDIIADVLGDRMTCPSNTLFFWAQDMNQDQLTWACNSLGQHETYFHSTLQTNNTPVVPDDNDDLRMVVFNNSTEWAIYGYALFGASTDNGGLYLEGDPSTPGDQATFFAYEDVPERPIFDIWNLRHEYMHYLDGRFITQGDFYDVNGAGRTVWYGEGVAEYISRRDCNDEAAAAAANATYPLSTILSNEYGVGQDRIYTWGYLAVRFMFEQRNTEFFAMLDLFKQGNYADYRNNLVDPWVANQTFDAEFAAWLPNVQSAGCYTDNTRPPSPVEPINVDDVQGTDVPGVDACANGAPVSDDNALQAGVAICLEDTTDPDSQQFAMYVPSGLVNVTLEVTLRHGTGETKLLHQFNGWPGHNDYDHMSDEPGTAQTVLETPVNSGWNYIRVFGQSNYSGVTLLARYIQNEDSNNDVIFDNGFEQN